MVDFSNIGGASAKTQISSSKTGGSGDALSGLSQDFNSFLTLLTTQLKNQDPTSPMETNEFTQQIIGFSQVQQAVNTNTNLEKLIDVNQNLNVSTAVGYIDHFVQAETDSFNLKNKSALLSYNLPKQAASVNASIVDENGKVVATYNEGKKAGENKITWDGKNSAGVQLPDGKYTLVVTAKDSAGVEIEGIKKYSTEMVSQVDLDGDKTTLYLGDIPIAMEKVKAVKGFYSDV